MKTNINSRSAHLPANFLRALAMASVLLLAFGLGTSAAQTTWTTWTGGGDGSSFNDASNWSNVVPASGVHTTINHVGELTINLSQNQTTGDLVILGSKSGDTQPKLTLNANGNTFVYNNTNSSFTPSATAHRNLVLQNGIFDSYSPAYLSFSYGAKGPLTIQVESGSTWNLRGLSNWLGYQSQNSGNIYVSGASGVKTSFGWGMDLALQAGSAAYVQVSGENSYWQHNTHTFPNPGFAGNWNRGLNIGNNGSAEFDLEAGGRITQAGIVNIGWNTAASGILQVNGTVVGNPGEPSRITATNVFVGGGTRSNGSTTAGGNGLAEFTNGGQGIFSTLHVFRNSVADKTGVLSIDGGFVDVSSASTFDADSKLQIDLNSSSQSAVFDAAALTLNSPIFELSLDPSFTSSVNDVISLVTFSSLNGTFKDLAEGATISEGIYQFEISYGPEIANTITLKTLAIPEPRAWALLGIGLVAVIARLRRRA